MNLNLFLDVDGVLADFVGAAHRVHGREPQPVTEWNFFDSWDMTAERFFAPMGFDFWYGLEPTDDAQRIVEVCVKRATRSRLALLSSPCETPGCADGKRAWVKKWFPNLLPNLILANAKQLIAHPRAVLIDDSDANAIRWVNRAGGGFVWPQPWNSQASQIPSRLLRLEAYLEGFHDGTC